MAQDNGVYTFNMPAQDVTVVVSFTPAVAQIGDTLYTSLSEAIDDAKAGDTITLLADDSVSFASNGIVIDKDLTINGNGHTIKGQSEVGQANVSSPGDITVSNVHGFYIKSGIVTISNLTMTEFGDEDFVNKFGLVPVLTAANYTSTLTLNNVNFNKFNRRYLHRQRYQQGHRFRPVPAAHRDPRRLRYH